MGTLLFAGLNGWEWPIILIAILLLFGGKKIPELMKGIGKGIRSFKDGMKEVEDEIKSDDK
ncbi:MAG: twin-arginine translocase TatA/TatE family subunit [Prevotellaceae bacterium]|jgi:sec-independent protein translocase protein TatA|nr:twin-arginine translocase TatA/TatE family subunit [Prevotellaceae bacterium]